MILLPLAYFETAAVIGFIVSIIVSVALSSIAAHMMAKDTYIGPKSASPNDNLTLRGEYLPLVMGTVRVGCLIGYVGKAHGYNVQVGEGPRSWGLFGNRKAIYTTSFFANGWHLISVGPVSAIETMFADGTPCFMSQWVPPTFETSVKYVRGQKVFYQVMTGQGYNKAIPRLTPEEYPSGSEFSVSGSIADAATGNKSIGRARIYWGEEDQPANASLQAAIGVKSTFPGVCYIFWERFELGSGGGRWPNMEYVVTRTPKVITTTENDLLTATGAVSPLTVSGAGVNKGYNPASLLRVIAQSTFPHGIGLGVGVLDLPAWDVMNADGVANEFATHYAIRQGDTYAQAMLDICGDVGAAMLDKQGKLSPALFRVQPSPPALTDANLIPSPDEFVTVDRSPVAVTNPVWTFASEVQFQYAIQDLGVPSDTGSLTNGMVSTRRFPIHSLTAQGPAVTASNLQRNGVTVNTTMHFEVHGQFRGLTTGDVVVHPDLGVLRVHSTLWSSQSPVLKLECSLENYGYLGIYALAPYLNPVARKPVMQDLGFNFWFVPSSGTDQSILDLWVSRIPAHEQIDGAYFWVSVNGTVVDTDEVLTRSDGLSGKILAPLAQDTPAPLPANTIVMDAYTNSVGHLFDLTLDAASWDYGKQLGVIDGEVMWVESIEKIDPLGPWAPSTAYAAGDRVVAAGDENMEFLCATAGTTGVNPPIGPYYAGVNITDGGVTWTPIYGRFSIGRCWRGQQGTNRTGHSAGSFLTIIPADTTKYYTGLSIKAGDTVCVHTNPVCRGEDWQFDHAATPDVCAIANSNLNVTEGDGLVDEFFNPLATEDNFELIT